MKWTRFVKADRFRDLAVHEGALLVRSGDSELSAKVERAEVARAAYVAKLKKGGWEELGEVERSLPVTATAKTKANVKKAWSDALAPLRRAYSEALEKAGMRADATFAAQTKSQEDPNDLARRCLEIAESTYDVEFARACFDDEEHMTGGWPIPDADYALFYESPARVADIAEKRFAGKLTEDDGRFPKRRVTGRKPTSAGGARAGAARSRRSS